LTYRHVVLFVAVVAAVATIAGCGNNPVATVGGVKITETEFNELLVERFGSDVLRHMVDRELIEQAAADKGIEVTEEELQEQVQQAKSEAPSEEAFQQALARQNISEEQWKDQLKMYMLVDRLRTHGIDPGEEALKEFFEQNKERFTRPATVSLSEIVVSSEDEAREVLEELESGDASFADLASRYSLSPSRQNGGERPEMPLQRVEPFLQEPARDLPVGEVSEPIEGGGSCSIVKVRDRQAEREASFETDREMIEEAYKQNNRRELDEILQEQMKQTNVNIVDPRFQQLNEVYTPVPDEIPQFGVEGGEAPAVEGHEGHDHAVPDTPETIESPEAEAPDADAGSE
jgi:foldase protein PrsA